MARQQAWAGWPPGRRAKIFSTSAFRKLLRRDYQAVSPQAITEAEGILLFIMDGILRAAEKAYAERVRLREMHGQSRGTPHLSADDVRTYWDELASGLGALASNAQGVIREKKDAPEVA